jgi:serine protein kinase
MSEMLARLETAGKEAAEIERWEGTFREFLQIFESGQYPSMGVLSHQRVHKMILSHGTERVDHFGQERTRYHFFEKRLFGIEQSIDEIMSYISSAAQRTETARRMLLLWGPPSSGKSDLVSLVKRGLEAYSKTDDGAIFAIKGSKTHENPFLLVPHELREDFEKQYGLPIEGELNPHTAMMLEQYKGNFMEVPIERIFISEARRVGVGTWLPSDTKSQDISDLIGDIDYAKIQKFGSESDPRAYNFDGELFAANRGVMEFIEGLKADEKFLRVNLTATQEKLIKAPRFGMIYVDVFIIMHTNEEEFTSFMMEKKYEAYHDRMVIVRVPYNLSVPNEVKIYEKLLAGTDAEKEMHIAPRTLEVAAMFAVLSRLHSSQKSDLTLLKKLKLYAGMHVKGFKKEQVPDIKKEAKLEGMSGISPRFVIDQISDAISRARDDGRDFITPLDVLRQVQRGVHSRDKFTDEDKTKCEQFIDIARTEWNDQLRNDIQKAFFLSYEDEARNLCENYLDQIEAACAGQLPRDPITGEETELDESLMDSVEDQIDISASGKEDFRNEILRAVAQASRKEMTFDYTQHSQLREGIQKALFEERKGVIRMTVSSRNPDPEAIKRINDVVDRMSKQQGYSAKAANELLKYASAHLFDK